MDISKKDLLIMAMLSIVSLSIAIPNLGLTQTPTTTEQFTAGQSFYVDLGSSANVKSIVILLKYGAYNITVSTGSPGSWKDAAVNVAYPYDSSKNQWSEEYYKWHETAISQTTQYLKLNFSQAGHDTIIAETAAIGQDNLQIPIQSITNLGLGSPNLQNLIDEQTLVQYPSDYMSNTYFDEIYFVRTAEQYLRVQMPYEWTHPPLGKLIQAAGIAVFGFSPFGWRIIGVIFATLMISVIYLLGKRLFDSWVGGFTAAFLLTFDFMHFAMARMGTADTYVVFFSLTSQLFFLVYLKGVLKEGWKTSVVPLLLAFVFFALGFSTKWLVLYGFAGQLVILAVMRLVDVKRLKGTFSARVYAFLDHPYSVIVGFLLFSIGIYFLTYIPDMLAGRSFLDVVGLQGSMYSYHSTLTATHPFSSPWFAWPLMFHPLDAGVHVPVWLEAASFPDGVTKSTIVLMGNPAVWWVGFAAIIAVTVLYISNLSSKRFQLKENLPFVFLVVLFFFQWLPYVLISRVVFIYHFYVSVPLLCLASAFFISKYWRYWWVKVLAVVYFAVVVAVFVLFYPVISGVPTATSTIDGLKWFGSWVF